MNYRELAEVIDRPYNTVRKWRGEITQLSGHQFKRVKVRNGKGCKNRTTYDFEEIDVKGFLLLSHFLKEGKSKAESIREIFGNEEVEELEKQNSDFDILERKCQALRGQIKALSKRIQDQKSELDTLKTKTSDLTERIENLEKRGIKNIFNKK